MYLWLLGVGFLLVVIALIRLRGLPEQKPDRVFGVIAGTGIALVVGVFGWFFVESSGGLTSSPAVPDLPQTELEFQVTSALGSSNRDATRVSDARLLNDQITIRWAINDNLSEGFVKDTARLEATEILEAIAGLDVDYDVALLEGTFPLVDQLGNESEELVVSGSWDSSLIDQINFENFNFKSVFDIAEDVFIHPAFQY